MQLILEKQGKAREIIVLSHLPKCVCNECHLGRKLLEHLICNNDNEFRAKNK